MQNNCEVVKKQMAVKEQEKDQYKQSYPIRAEENIRLV